jgi:hypothetical protein
MGEPDKTARPMHRSRQIWPGLEIIKSRPLRANPSPRKKEGFRRAPRHPLKNKVGRDKSDLFAPNLLEHIIGPMRNEQEVEVGEAVETSQQNKVGAAKEASQEKAAEAEETFKDPPQQDEEGATTEASSGQKSQDIIKAVFDLLQKKQKASHWDAKDVECVLEACVRADPYDKKRHKGETLENIWTKIMDDAALNSFACYNGIVSFLILFFKNTIHINNNSCFLTLQNTKEKSHIGKHSTEESTLHWMNSTR